MTATSTPGGDKPGDEQPEQPEQPEQQAVIEDPAQDAASQAMLDHQARCGCIMPANLPQDPRPEQQGQQPGAPTHQASSPPPMNLPIGWFGVAVSVPSVRQNRTTQPIGRRDGHPVNANKPLSIITYLEGQS